MLCLGRRKVLLITLTLGGALLTTPVAYAGGIKGSRVRTKQPRVSKSERRQRVVVFAGLPGSGKSTLAKAVQRVIPKAGRTSFGDQVRSYVSEKGWVKNQANDAKASQYFAKNPRLLTDRVVRKIKQMGAEWTLVDGAREQHNVERLREHFDVTVVSLEVSQGERFSRMLKRQRFANETEATLRARDKRELALGVKEVMARADMQVGGTPLFRIPAVARVFAETLLRGAKTKPGMPIRAGGADWAYQLQNLRAAAEAVPSSGRARFLSKTLLKMPRIAGGKDTGFAIIRDRKAESAPWQKDHLLAVPSGEGDQPVWLHQVKDPRFLGRMARRLSGTLQSIHKDKGGFADIALWVNLPNRISMPVLHLHAKGRPKVKRYAEVNRRNYREISAKGKGDYRVFKAKSENLASPFVLVAKTPKTNSARDRLLGMMMMDAGTTATSTGIYNGRIEVSVTDSLIKVRVVARR